MNLINFQEAIVSANFKDFISVLWKECTPKLLIVTDTLNYDENDDFGLTQFVASLEASTIHGMTPQVIKASRLGSAGADITNYSFTNPTNGLLKSRYDVLFMLSVRRENQNQLPQSEIDAIAQFMQDGGGVFATGDHEDLGAAMCRDIPRVRNMRYWRRSNTPDVADDTRLSTNVFGVSGSEEFNDQSDIYPQSLYLNYRTEAGGNGNTHPLMQASGGGYIDVFPDQPHEGECHLPESLNTNFTLDNRETPEWPNATAGGTLSPEIVAISVSHGDGFPNGDRPKQPLEPRSFVAVCAYDGQRANVGRVVTDATWHHFVNVNLDGTDAPEDALQPGGVDSPALTKIRQYYANLADWLMPKNTRKCLRDLIIVRELARFPLFEELKLLPLKEAKAPQLEEIGEAVFKAVMRRSNKARARQIVSDVLEDALGEGKFGIAAGEGNLFENQGNRSLGMIALGAVVTGTAEALVKSNMKDARKADLEKTFVKPGVENAKTGVQIASTDLMKQLQALQTELGRIGGGGGGGGFKRAA